MVQNRNKLIELFIGNVSNYIVHKILEKAIDDESITNRYDKESVNSFNIAKKYRERINPRDVVFPEKDILYVKDKIVRKVKAELMIRISKGYENIDLDLVGDFVDTVLKDLAVA